MIPIPAFPFLFYHPHHLLGGEAEKDADARGVFRLLPDLHTRCLPKSRPRYDHFGI